MYKTWSGLVISWLAMCILDRNRKWRPSSMESFILQNSKIIVWSLKKIWKKILGGDNVLFYQRVKSQIKIFHNLVYTKIIKSGWFGRVTISHCSLLSNVRLCHCCTFQNTRYFLLDILHVGRIQHCLHPELFSDIFGTSKYEFHFFLQNKGFHLSTLIGIGHPNAKRIAEAK